MYLNLNRVAKLPDRFTRLIDKFMVICDGCRDCDRYVPYNLEFASRRVYFLKVGLSRIEIWIKLIK